LPSLARTLSFAGLAAVAVLMARGPVQRIEWTTSRLVGSPDPPTPYQLVPAFEGFPFHHPIYIAQDPASERFFVAELEGKIYSFLPGDPESKRDLFLEIPRQIYAFSFHPDYARNGQVFVFSNTELEHRRGAMSKVYRFTAVPGSNPPRLDPASETVIVEWIAGGHNGGEAVIGPDGYLYVSTGDSTGGSDRKNTGQGVDDLLSVMMRLDVDHPSEGRAYSIPKDNPFVDYPGARPEVWAYGFRNPWRFSFDPVTGRPWVGDVGQDLWEMIELSKAGANHGWSVKEGTHPFHPGAETGPTPIVPPVVEHHHTECRSITGGYVYQGDKFPELRGAYVYGDYQYGKMWALRYDYYAENVTWHETLLDSPFNLASFGMGRDGSFYGLDYEGGRVYQLARRPPEPEPRQPFPRKLSETGLFASTKDYQLANGVMPYSINAPFWSDGALKERYFALPPGGSIQFDEERAWAFPDGAVTVKSFALELEPGNPASRKRIETRVVLKQEEHWVGYSYAWNEDQTDAELVESAGLDRVYRIADAAAPGGFREQKWHYPSRQECMFCHSRAAGFVLGLNTRQMNTAHDYGDGEATSQLAALDRIGMFERPLEKAPAEYARLPDPFDEASANLEARVRAYLDVNCAMCHVNDGGGNANMVVSYNTELDKTRLIEETPMHDIGGTDMRVVAKGSPERSVLYTRMTTRAESQMPPSSTSLVDERGAALVAEWIRSLGR
jgi:uncharacterized repeat protein (TIGR03806 family)